VIVLRLSYMHLILCTINLENERNKNFLLDSNPVNYVMHLPVLGTYCYNRRGKKQINALVRLKRIRVDSRNHPSSALYRRLSS
jgi:hypothetical protein